MGFPDALRGRFRGDHVAERLCVAVRRQPLSAELSGTGTYGPGSRSALRLLHPQDKLKDNLPVVKKAGVDVMLATDRGCVSEGFRHLLQVVFERRDSVAAICGSAS